LRVAVTVSAVAVLVPEHLVEHSTTTWVADDWRTSDCPRSL
jgi:hypothetical protein